MSATRSSTTASSWRACARAPSSSRSSTRSRRDRQPVSSPPTACRSRCRPRPRRAICSTSTRPARWSPRCTRGRAPPAQRPQMVLIGHAGHPEVIGTMGQLPEGAVTLVETWPTSAIASCPPTREARLHHPDHALGRRHRRDRRVLKRALPRDHRAAARRTSATPPPTARRRSRRWRPGSTLLVVGAPNSSNSQRLVEVAERAGCAYAQLVQRAPTSTGAPSPACPRLGITAGASAPEVLVEEVIDAFRPPRRGARPARSGRRMTDVPRAAILWGLTSASCPSSTAWR
jgi:hypothetical protein